MKRWAGQAAAAIGIWALFLTTGCGTFFVYPGSLAGGGSGSSTGDYVYVANTGTGTNNGTLAGFSVGTGTLTAVSGSPYSLGFVPTAVAVNPANTLVFVAGNNGVSGFINVYSIGAGGALSLLLSNPIDTFSEASIDVSPDGQWLLGVDENPSVIALSQAVVDEYKINSSTGKLTLGSGGSFTYTVAPVPTVVPRAIKFAPNGAYVFVAVGTAGDVEFTFNTNSGALASSQKITLGSGTSDNALAVNLVNNILYLYIAESGASNGLAAYSVDSGSGVLSPVGGSPFITNLSHPFSVVVNKAGTAVYVANQLDGSISGYSISSTGAVAPLSPATFTTPSAPWALAIDNSGKYLLSASNAGNPDLTMYSYDSTTVGKLDVATEIAAGSGPVAIATTH
jgi:6-phosphogluconolactonase